MAEYKVDFQEVKANVTMKRAIELLQLKAKPDGDGAWRTKCPRCARSDDRSLKLTEGRGYYCFPARTGGDVIALASHVRGCSALEAAQFLAGTSSQGTVPGDSPRTGRNSSSQRQERGFDPSAYTSELKTSHEVLEPLGIAPETLERFGAGYCSTGVLAGRLAFRVDDAQGQFRVFCGLALKGEDPAVKFGSKTFDPATVIFNAHRANGSEVRLARDVVEAMTIYEQTGEDAICFLSDLLRPEHLELLAGLQTQMNFQVCL